MIQERWRRLRRGVEWRWRLWRESDLPLRDRLRLSLPLKTIYVVTVFGPQGPQTYANKNGRTRTWGWYVTRTAAETAVLQNWTDLFENGYYRWAVIEAFPEGLSHYGVAVGWYEATYKERQHRGRFREEPTVCRIEPPEWTANKCNWGMS